MTTIITDFWFKHPEYWIAVGSNQAISDKDIYDRFHDYDFLKEDSLGKVIYLDQFVRHFSRVEPLSEEIIKESRISAANIVEAIGSRGLVFCKESELVWYLMPWKHLERWSNIFMAIDMWVRGKPISDFPLLNRFFVDTYKKAYTFHSIKEKITVLSEVSNYDASAICEYYPERFISGDWLNTEVPSCGQALSNRFRCLKEPVTVSLSGGVDSMLMTALLCRSSSDVVACHIVYGNRAESVDECNLISDFCKKLGVPLYIYKIEWLKRGSVDRAFYESFTREIRFNVYKAIGRPVLLGHIQEDVVENIWTNLAKGNNLDNLAKISLLSEEGGVKIYRPWLNVKKPLIYEVAELMAIPYLKNTTPSWSNRGKFREHFYAATKAQYGDSVDDKMIEAAERIRKQALLLDRLLYKGIRESWDTEKRRINVTVAISCDLDADGWLNVLTDLAHSRAILKKPSYAACCDLKERLDRGEIDGLVVCLKKGFTIKFVVEHGVVWLCLV